MATGAGIKTKGGDVGLNASSDPNASSVNCVFGVLVGVSEPIILGLSVTVTSGTGGKVGALSGTGGKVGALTGGKVEPTIAESDDETDDLHNPIPQKVPTMIHATSIVFKNIAPKITLTQN